MTADQKRHDATVAALEKSPHARVVPVASQAWMLAAKGLAAVKAAIGR